MGLLGSLLKIGGKVLKKAASVATHGASDQVLKAAKSLGMAKKLLKPGQGSTIGMQALANRIVPQVRITPTLQQASAGNASPGQYSGGSPMAPKRKRRRKKATTTRATRAAPSRTRRRQAAAAGTSTGGRRAAPRGGLNLRAMSASWKAAGKPGTWREWVSSPSSQIRNAR